MSDRVLARVARLHGVEVRLSVQSLLKERWTPSFAWQHPMLMSLGIDPSARALLKLTASVSVRSMQMIQLFAQLLTGLSVIRTLGCVLAHESLSVLCVSVITSQVQVPGYLYLYDLVVVNLLVQLLNCFFSYTTILLTAVAVTLLGYSLTLHTAEIPEQPQSPAIRRKYFKHKR